MSLTISLISKDNEESTWMSLKKRLRRHNLSEGTQVKSTSVLTGRNGSRKQTLIDVCA